MAFSLVDVPNFTPKVVDPTLRLNIRLIMQLTQSYALLIIYLLIIVQSHGGTNFY